MWTCYILLFNSVRDFKIIRVSLLLKQGGQVSLTKHYSAASAVKCWCELKRRSWVNEKDVAKPSYVLHFISFCYYAQIQIYFLRYWMDYRFSLFYSIPKYYNTMIKKLTLAYSLIWYMSLKVKSDSYKVSRAGDTPFFHCNVLLMIELMCVKNCQTSRLAGIEWNCEQDV